MSISTKLHLNNRKYNLADIIDVLKNSPNLADVSSHHATSSAGYYTINFCFKNATDYKRQLSVFTKDQVAGLSCMTLDLGSDNNSQALFEEIAQKLGGIFIPNDYENKSHVFHDPTHENLAYMLKKAQLLGKASNPEDFIKFLKEKY